MDQILYWNDVALEANRVSHTNGRGEQTGPPLSARALGIVHLAMYDAFAGVSGNPPELPPYLPDLPDPAPDASADAAVAAAARAALSSLFPSQRPFFDQRHAQAGLEGPGLSEGEAFGRLVAQRILKDREDDPDASGDGYVPLFARGRHRVDPDNPGQGFHAPFYGARSKLFAATERFMLPSPPPPSLEDPIYIEAFLEVRNKGIALELLGTVPADQRRTVDQELIGLYWAYDGSAGLGTPPRLYNQIVREVAMNTPNPTTSMPNTVAQNARLFALVNAASADAGILAWDQKYIHEFWRPVVGIREHDVSLGPLGAPGNDIDDETRISWLPLGSPNTNATPPAKNFTPNFPAYPSGHSVFGAAAFHITRLFYGITETFASDALFEGLSFVSDELNGFNRDNRGTVRPRHERSFPGGLWQMIQENGMSRIYLGVHWTFDNTFLVLTDIDPDEGVLGFTVPDDELIENTLGLRIAEDIFESGLTKSTVGPRS